MKLIKVLKPPSTVMKNKKFFTVTTKCVRTVRITRTTGQPTITVSVLLDALTGLHFCETDRTLCVSAKKKKSVIV